jgi:xanthine/CO dehydrogenase XdhC/CoxF family maturation factor
MNELLSLLSAADSLRQSGEPFLVATVVRVSGSSYRRPGARMLLTRDRWIAGSVSGGCLEADLVRKGWWRTTGGPCIVRYDASVDADELGWGLGLGCEGIVDVLVERGDAAAVDPLAIAARCVGGQECAAVATVIADGPLPLGARVSLSAGDVVESDVADSRWQGALLAECRRVLESGPAGVASVRAGGATLEALVELSRPPPRLFVLGAGHDAVPVVTLAKAVGWEVFVAGASARVLTKERFTAADGLLFGRDDEVARAIDGSDRPLAVVMAHDYERDRASLAMLLGTRARYIGMLGPKRRTARMLDELGVARDARIHAPVGLAIGAESPQEIALAIVAETQAVLTRAAGASLRELPGSIHARSAAE